MSTQKDSQKILEQVIRMIEKGRLVEKVSAQQAGSQKVVVEQLAHRQQLTRLDKVLSSLHVADLANVMENLSPDDRMMIWALQAPKRGGLLLLELSDSVAEQVMQSSDNQTLTNVLQQLDADDLGYLSDLIPEDLLEARRSELSHADKDWFNRSLQYEKNSVGGLMDMDMVLIHDNSRLEQVLQDLRQYKSLSPQIDKLFVIDARGTLVGVLFWHNLVINEPDQRVKEVMSREVVRFQPTDSATEAARAFERYDLVSAPVVNQRGRPLGRLAVEEVMDFVRDDMGDDVLNAAGLQGQEDLFASIWKSAQNRWLWLSLSLLTAFLASRVIGLFEDTIARYVALAALMPIVAAIGGNTGNQTTTLVVRGLALSQINDSNLRRLISKEMKLSVLNGIVWGSVVGLFAFLFYSDPMLSLIIAASMMLTLLLAAILGLVVPLSLQAINRDPALGAGVLVTALTDSMGFFIFLGLAALFI